MSTPIQKVCFVAGTPRFSGALQEGSIQTTDGGGIAYSSLSGLAAAALIQSGPGRLNTIAPLTSLASGQYTVFFDSAVATSGAPFAASGHTILAVLPPMWAVGAGASGVVNANALPGSVQRIQAPFFSGLCAAPIASGAAGFSVTLTPQVINSGGNSLLNTPW